MSAISGIPPASYTPASHQVKPPSENPQPAPPSVQPVVKDSDSDSDSSKGGKIDLYA
jgi:hypothetical protein